MVLSDCMLADAVRVEMGGDQSTHILKHPCATRRHMLHSDACMCSSASVIDMSCVKPPVNMGIGIPFSS